MSPRRIKIGLIIATLERGGAEKQLALLATHLDRSRFAPFVVALTRGGPYREVLESGGVPCELIGKGLGVSPLALARLVRVLRRRRPDVVHTWMFTANAYGRVAARLAGARRVIANEMCVVDWKGPIRLAVDRILVPITDRVVAISDSVAKSLHGSGIPAPLIETIYDAFDPTGWPTRDLDAPREVGVSPRIAAVGRLYRQKRYDVVLRAMALIVRDFPEAELTIAGEGPERPQLEALVAELGIRRHVRLPGVVDDVPRLLAHSDLFVMGSDYEGLPSSLMETMYVGVPVVATDAPGISDLVRGGVTGILAPREDFRALARGAVSLLRDPERRRNLAEQARQQILQQYSVHRMVGGYEALYERMAAAGLTVNRGQR